MRRVCRDHHSTRLRVVLLIALIGYVSAAAPAVAQDGRSLWIDRPSAAMSIDGVATIASGESRSLQVDAEGLERLLRTAPPESVPGDFSGGLELALPLPGGGFARYRVVESSVMAPGLQERFPTIRTYVGRGIDEAGATLRLSISPQGVHAASRRREGTFYIDPAARLDRGSAISYWRRSLRPREGGHRHAPEILDEADDLSDAVTAALNTRGSTTTGLSTGHSLRIYRIAIAATGEYTRFHSREDEEPTVARGLAAIAVALNRVNEIYERELSIRMVLVEGNDQIVYTDPDTDPYSNFNAGAMLGQNQTNLDAVIGSANYDIGHIFSTGGGGLAGLGVVCWEGYHARGVTGLPSPVNDPFYVDYVAHEIGHQFGANHTFNGSSGGCSDGQRNSSTAVEPGSGSTIMAYAGICGTQNLQHYSHDYFHNTSLIEISRYVTTGRGSSCGTVAQTGSAIPEPVATAGYTIPVGTPFLLSGSAIYSGDLAGLTYSWEGLDRGAASAPPGADGWNGMAPFFRSLQPSTSGSRFFPRIDAYAARQPTLGEGLPEAATTLNFRFTVRSNAAGGGTARDLAVSVSVSDQAGPFVITAPREPVSWEGGSDQWVRWDVAGTASAVFGAERVDILLSRDLHDDFVEGTAIVLAADVRNSGAARVRIPNDLVATRARLMVRASAGIFYDVSRADIAIAAGQASEPEAQPLETALSAVFPNPVVGGRSRVTVNLTLPDAASQRVRVVLIDALGREAAVVYEGTAFGGDNLQLTLDTAGLAAGVYYMRAVGEDFALVRPMTVVR
jgi:hypothetical protein